VTNAPTPRKKDAPSLLTLALAVYRGELSEGQALRILRGEDEDEVTQTSDA